MTAMFLSTGTYTIRSAAFETNPFVGRGPVEDDSFYPKRIVSLPEEVEPTVWSIEYLQDGRYFLSAEDSHTSVIDNYVYAVLLPFPAAEEWNLVRLPEYGANQYLIQTSNGTLTWVLPEEMEGTQVAVKPPIVIHSFPARYPANERWIIDSIDSLD